MNPYPLAPLNHFTTPLSFTRTPLLTACLAPLALPRRHQEPPRLRYTATFRQLSTSRTLLKTIKPTHQENGLPNVIQFAFASTNCFPVMAGNDLRIKKNLHS